MDRYCLLCTTLMIALIAQLDVAQGAITITGDFTPGGNANITCDGSTFGNLSNVQQKTLGPQDSIVGTNYYYQVTGPNAYPGDLATSNGKYSLDSSSVANMTMTINNLQCSDGKDYYCIYQIYRPGLTVIYANETRRLTMKARPNSPVLTVPTANYTGVLEQTNITVVCSAAMGQPGRGLLQWKLYRGNAAGETVLDNDPRIVRKNSTFQQGIFNCFESLEQTFSMQVSRTDQNLVIACFARSLDFPPEQTPDFCTNMTSDLCAKTASISVFYTVTNSSMTLTRNPTGNIYKGMPVILICQAPGYPTPTFSWLKIGDDNQTLTAVTDGTRSQLTLSNLPEGDRGDYNYRCTASNTVLGRVYTAVQEINFDVLLTTTTATTTTVTTTPTTAETTNASSGATGDQNKGNNNDDRDRTIIIVVVVVGSILIIALVIGVVCWKKRSKKEIEEPSEKPYNNNRSNLSFQNPQQQPDLVADKKFQNPTVDNMYPSSLSGSSPSFNEKKEDGLMYADLTYDNKPRSRKPLAINDTSSDYSDIQMPQV